MAGTSLPLKQIVGFALVFAWCIYLFYNAGLSFPTIDILVLAHSHLGSSVSYIAVSLLLVVFAHRVGSLHDRRDPTILCGIAATASTIAIGLVEEGYLGDLWLFVAVFACGACSAVLKIVYGEFFAAYGTKGTAVCLAASVSTGFVLYFALSFFDPFMATFPYAMLPLLGALLLRNDGAPSAAVAGSLKEGALSNLPLRLCIAGMLLFCVFGIVRAGGMLSSPDPTASHSRLWTLLIFVAPVFVATVIAFMLKDKNISAVFYGVIVLAVVGALALDVPGFGFNASIACTCLGTEVLYYLTWFIMVDKLIRHQTSALFSLAALHFFRAVGILVGQLIGEALLVDARSTTIAMLVVLVFAALVGLGSKGMVITLSDPAKEVIGIPKANIAALVERYGLTARENEIVELWCLGHSSSYIEKTFSISHNTAKTHIAHIYQKTGATTREELIALAKSCCDQ